MTKIWIFDQNLDFWPKFRFPTKIWIFDENLDFWPNFRVFSKNSIFNQKSPGITHIYFCTIIFLASLIINRKQIWLPDYRAFIPSSWIVTTKNVLYGCIWGFLSYVYFWTWTKKLHKEKKIAPNFTTTFARRYWDRSQTFLFCFCFLN